MIPIGAGQKRVLIIQAQIKQYRAPFFIGLYRALKTEGVSLRVAYSEPTESETGKNDNVDLPVEFGVKVKAYSFLGNRLLYQPLLSEISKADLVVVEQANKHILNLVLRTWTVFGNKRVAFWGHGRNRQGHDNSVREALKRRSVGWVDWWFAYTRGVSDYLVSTGFPFGRITTVCNSVDTCELRRSLGEVSAEEIVALRHDLDIAGLAQIGLYCGGLYPDKHLDFLVDAAVRIRKAVPAFNLLVVGGGPEAEKIQAAARAHSWIHYLGPRFGKEKAICFGAADVFMMPGAVGLAILDAFVARLPFLTVRMPNHGPEIDYLEQGVNGFMVERGVVRFAEIVVRILQNQGLLHRLQQGAEASAQKYSIENMVENFRSGVCQCLGHVAKQGPLAVGDVISCR